jgi:transcriptional regulator with XRE-family HTH domain
MVSKASKVTRMKIDSQLTDPAILAELGRRIEAARLLRNLTQEDFAGAADISRPTLQRLEAGASVQLSTLVRVLRALDLLPALDLLLPPARPGPVEQLDTRGRGRKRASRTAKVTPLLKTAFTWGDER